MLLNHHACAQNLASRNSSVRFSGFTGNGAKPGRSGPGFTPRRGSGLREFITRNKLPQINMCDISRIRVMCAFLIFHLYFVNLFYSTHPTLCYSKPYIGERRFPARGYFIPACVGIGVWAAQKIWCRRRVARPPVHFQKMGAFPENVFWHKSTPYERSRSIWEPVLHEISLRIFLEMPKFDDSR